MEVSTGIASTAKPRGSRRGEPKGESKDDSHRDNTTISIRRSHVGSRDGGEGLTTNPMFRKKSIAEEVAPGLQSTWHTSSGSAMLRELGIAHSSVDTDDSNGIENILGVLYGVYKPEMFYFDIINFFHKLILWATLVFFGYGSQLQVGTALLLCVVRLVIHTRFEPYRERMDNWFDETTLTMTALIRTSRASSTRACIERSWWAGAGRGAPV